MTKMDEKEMTVFHDKTNEESNQAREVDLTTVTNNTSLNPDVVEAAEMFQNMKPPDEVIKWTWDTSITDELPDDFFEI